MRNDRTSRRGSALLAVLWLSAALAAIAFSVATSVRSETGRVSSSVDGLKAQYLASGAVERALLYAEWGARYRTPDGTPLYPYNIPRFVLQFPSGQVDVEIVSETAKLNVNTSPPEDLFRLLAALGVEPGRAEQIVAGIVAWRSPAPPGALDILEVQSSGPNPSFPPRHASMEEIEELLFIQGVTPELFYGTYERDAQGVLRLHHGLRDCLSVYGGNPQVDVNTAQPEVLQAVGLAPEQVDALVRARSIKPFQNAAELTALASDLPGFQRLRIGMTTLETVRATARPRRPDGSLSDARRSVAALVKIMGQGVEPYHVLRWYGNVWVE
ncbi:MAG TPA: type II secretion system protein GspK [Bryobacteraceae bacterium]|nr:type II secretion system protein GspK [Bryobacteraceae bacterium]